MNYLFYSNTQTTFYRIPCSFLAACFFQDGQPIKSSLLIPNTFLNSCSLKYISKAPGFKSPYVFVLTMDCNSSNVLMDCMPLMPIVRGEGGGGSFCGGGGGPFPKGGGGGLLAVDGAPLLVVPFFAACGGGLRFARFAPSFLIFTAAKTFLAIRCNDLFRSNPFLGGFLGGGGTPLPPGFLEDLILCVRIRLFCARFSLLAAISHWSCL